MDPTQQPTILQISQDVSESVSYIEIVENSRRRMHLCMQDDQNVQKTMVLTSAEETRLTCFILLQKIFSEVINLV